ncbi:phospholipid-transporting ATPase ABCA3 [Patella vulgata]|uniref:phospholipid-transporting ATPase ABCA3 n=1 Tax=Patella vulgata TaxID=6465 RepID=UPI0024A7E9B5|nr:phospholipid-transporting ATPase ABCA3 [Patella vulgata]
MVNFFRQVLLLLWKNFVIQRRKVCVSVFEVILPLLFAVIVLVVRILVTSEHISEPKIYPNKTVQIYKWYKSSKTLIYAPNNARVDSIMDEFVFLLNSEAAPVPKYNFSSMGFPTEEELLNYYTLNPENISIAIVFEDMTATTSVLPKNIKYSLRPKEDDVSNWRTDRTVPFAQTGGPRTNPDPDYIGTSFLVYQTLMDQAIIRTWNSTADFSNIKFELQKMPYPPYFKDPMIIVLQQQLPLLLLLSFILNVIMTAKSIIYEKERKLKESMKLMGLSNAAHWTAWFLTVFIYLTVAMIIYTLLMGLPISPKGPVLTNTDPSIIFVFLMCYGLSIIAFSFLISVFFNKANVGAAAAGILFFATYVPYFFISTNYETMTRTEKLAACLLSTQAMSMGAYTIGLYEGTGDGIQWSNIAEPATVDDNFSMLDAILMMLGDTAIYMIIVWYVDNVHPGEFGVPKPFYFPFTRSYWCGNKTANFSNIAASTSDPAHFEKEPSGMKAGVTISGLKKEFKTGGKKKKAVNNMNLNMLEGQISVLLGHNGAGKTTTMSMLTGFITPTSGTAIVNGYDITTDIAGVRESLGLCPQHNILFDTMTVDEHLEFFALLKGADRSSVKAEVATMAQEIGLETKRSTRSMHLSGGQKRKLSVGIALISDSKIVILDEPTSGMDPAARRQTWDILQRNRANRTIILTTHFMDEADLLGDRIAIMSEGEVKCCGSSHFLKKLHGAGYHLVIVKSETCNIFNVTQVVQKYIPSSVLESQISAEVSYLLPNEESAKFSALFREIEDRKNELGINSFGTSATTMEEVFLKVGEGVEDEDDEPQLNGVQNPAFQKDVTQNGSPSTNGNATEINIDRDILAFNKGFRRVSGFKLELSRFYGMFIKKAIHTWRNKVVTLVQLLVPVFATAAALAIANVQTDPIQKPSLTLNLAPFGGSISSYGVSNATTMNNDLSDKYGNLFSAAVDTAQNLTATEAQDYNSYFVSKAAALGTRTYNRKMVIGAEFSDDGAGNTVAKMWYNGQPYHSAPISVAYMMNTFARYFSGDDYEIETRNYPLPADAEKSSNSTSLFSGIFGFVIAFCILFGMAFLSSSFVVFLVKEKQFGAKHLQKVSGVGTMVYWLSNITWDFINYLIPCVLIIAVFGIFGTEEYLSGSNLGYVSLSFLLYGLDILPFVYLMQYLFTTPATGMVVLIIINIFTGLVSLMAVFILGMPGLGTTDVADALDWIFSIVFPQFNLGKCIMNIYTNYNILDACGQLGYPDICSTKPEFQCCLANYVTEDYLSIEVPGIGRYLLLMVVQAVVFFGFTLLIEAQIMQKLWYKIRPVSKDVAPVTYHQSNGSLRLMEDDDVSNEKARLANMSMDSAKDSFILKDLFKRYGTFVAVDHISVGIAERECFGLLGQNGAGKTTTFKMLTGDVMLTDGNAYLESNDIKSDIQKVQENMGYCPQFDALIDQMTGRETLYMYGRLRGVPEDHLKGVVNSLIDILMLRKHADKKTQVYSGGNKRKLSVAIALIGDPGFILLDEPSSGVDPRARRQLWNVLSKVRDSGKTLILTSHSMEECDALCTRVAIMVNGVFKCLGSPQHLKNKFGQGYTLICRMKTGEEDGETYPIYPLVEFIKQQFPSTIVFDDHQGYAHFQIPDKSIPLAGIFEVMEKSKEEYFVEDYSVHQTTLEQVFLTFTGKQIAPRETKAGLCQGFSCC